MLASLARRTFVVAQVLVQLAMHEHTSMRGAACQDVAALGWTRSNWRCAPRKLRAALAPPNVLAAAAAASAREERLTLPVLLPMLLIYVDCTIHRICAISQAALRVHGKFTARVQEVSDSTNTLDSHPGKALASTVASSTPAWPQGRDTIPKNHGPMTASCRTCADDWHAVDGIVLVDTGQLHVVGVIRNVHQRRVDHLVVDGVLRHATHAPCAGIEIIDEEAAHLTFVDVAGCFTVALADEARRLT